MKRETFIMAIEAIEKQYHYDIEKAKSLACAFTNCKYTDFLDCNNYSANALIHVLKEEMNDTELCEHLCSWIEWFCWETNFGNESFRLKAYRKDGSVIKMYTAGDLYDYLIEVR